MNQLFFLRSVQVQYLLFGLFVFGLLTACQKEELITTNQLENFETQKIESRTGAPMADDYDASVAIEWYRMVNQLIKTTPGYTPPVAARALGYIGVGFYEVMYPGNPGRQSLAGQLTDLNSEMLPFVHFENNYHWGIIANAYFLRITEHLFPNATTETKQAVADLYQKWADNYFDFDLGELSDKTQIMERSVDFGFAMADAIFDWSATDDIGHEGYLKNFPADYVVPTGRSQWQPTGSQLTPLQPYWGEVRTFIPNSSNINPKAPNPFSTMPNSFFFREAKAVHDITKNLTNEQRIIAYYWADGAGTITPPGHSASMAIQIIEAHQLNLGEAADVMAKIGIGVADAFILCWKTKYQFSLLRPVSYINAYIDSTWQPLLDTPPFPEHTSGHSTQSGATAEILTFLFGNVPFIDKTHEGRADANLPASVFRPRRFPNFYEAALEAANSRLYGGIHYNRGNMVGLEQGYYIGKLVNKLHIYCGE